MPSSRRPSPSMTPPPFTRARKSSSMCSPTTPAARFPAPWKSSAPPAIGTATVTGGKILYAHSGSSAAPVTFTYRVGNISGSTARRPPSPSTSPPRCASPTKRSPCRPPRRRTPGSSWTRLPGLTFTRPICLASVPGDANQLYVCEQGGVIKRVADVTSLTPATNVFLDLDDSGRGIQHRSLVGRAT